MFLVGSNRPCRSSSWGKQLDQANADIPNPMAENTPAQSLIRAPLVAWAVFAPLPVLSNAQSVSLSDFEPNSQAPFLTNEIVAAQGTLEWSRSFLHAFNNARHVVGEFDFNGFEYTMSTSGSSFTSISFLEPSAAVFALRLGGPTPTTTMGKMRRTGVMLDLHWGLSGGWVPYGGVMTPSQQGCCGGVPLPAL
jgi:hypothetical protein